MVYTNAAGDRLVKANDGKYYPADQVNDDGSLKDPATATPEANPIASVVNPDGSTTAPTTMGNVKSNIGPNNGAGPITENDAKTAVTDLLDDTTGLNNVATVGDLQAIAQAGLDFTGNNNATTVHRALGTKLTVVGERNDSKTAYTADESAKNNLIVEADDANNTLTVKMAKELKDLKSIEASDSIKVGTDENGVSIKPEGTTTTKTVDGKTTTSTLGADGTSITGPDGKSAEYKLDGAKIADKDNVTEIKPDGLTAKSADPNDKSEAHYGKDGLTVKGDDGKDAIALTSTKDPATGATTNTLALKGKDDKDAVSISSGADGKDPTMAFAKDGENGTGTITGLKDVERNPDGTAKDRTQAANAGYVDDRLAEMNAGKPFEYFEKDPATGDVKKDADGKPVQLVRGKDGNFYKPSELEGATYNPTTGKYEKDGQAITATPVDSNNVTVQAMPSPTGNPLEMGNIGSGLGLDDSEKGNEKPLTAEQAKEAMNGKDGKSGLLEKTGASLNNAATVKDLQALAQAGLDFSGNVGETHRPLGSKLAIEGKSGVTDEQYTADYSTDNIATKVTADGKLEIAMKKEPEFNKLTVKTDSAPAVSFNTEKLIKDNTAYDINGNKIAGKEEVLTALNVGDKDGNPVKITGVADGDITPDSTQAVNGRQVYALTNGNQVVQNNDGSTVTYAKDKDGSVITEVKRDKNGNPVLDADGKEIVQPKEYKLTTYNVEGQTEFVTNSVITAVHNMNEQGIKFFHTNDDKVSPIDQTGPNGIDSSASGAYATAVGYQATASGTNALAMGKGATATGENSIAIGTGNQVAASKSGAFGDPNIIMGTTSENDAVSGSYAIGNDNVINSSNTFVLGNDVNNKLDANGKITGQAAGNTVENSVYLGNKSTATAGDGSATGTLKNLKQDGTAGSTTTAGSTGTVSSAKVGNMTYGGFAGAKADGVVSVGAAGNERRVQNVAAGEISATSTDAINGSQLYSVAKGVDQLDGKVNRMNRKLRSGIAAATAMTNIPQVTLPGKNALGAGVGSYDGQGALAVGYSRMSDNGRVILKLSAGASTQGKYNAGAGVAVQW